MNNFHNASRSNSSLMNPARLAGFTVVLDPGHSPLAQGGKDPVTAGAPGELKFNWDVTQKLKAQLEAMGATVVLTKNDINEQVGNKTRAERGNAAKGNLFISIHFDDQKSTSQGYALYVPDKKGIVDDNVLSISRLAANSINTSMQNTAGIKSLGVKGESATNIGSKQGALTKSLYTHVPVVTVECFNHALGSPLHSEKAQNDFVKALAEGIAKSHETVPSLSSNNPRMPSVSAQDKQDTFRQNISVAPPAKGQTTTPAAAQIQQTSTKTSQTDLVVLSGIARGNENDFVRLGSSGPAVLETKKLLNTWLVANGKSALELNTTADAEMIQAIKDFQKLSGLSKEMKLFNKGGLKVDGIVGPWTLTALMKANGIEDPQQAFQAAYGADYDLMSVLNTVKGGIFVDSTTGIPNQYDLADIQYGQFSDPVSARKLKAEEISSREAPEDVLKALRQMHKDYDDYRYRYGAIGNDGAIDCSAFVSQYLRRLGLKARNGDWRQTTSTLINATTLFPGQIKQISSGEVRPGDFIVWEGHTGVVGESGLVLESASRFRGIGEKTGIAQFVSFAGGKETKFFRPLVVGDEPQPVAGASVGYQHYKAFIDASEQKYRLPKGLLAGLVQQESGYDPNSTSSAGAMGLTQLMPGTAAGLGVKNPYDPSQSIEGGAKYLRQMLDQFGGDVSMALAAYNAGDGRVRRSGHDLSKLPHETQAYVPAVLRFQKSYL